MAACVNPRREREGFTTYRHAYAPRNLGRRLAAALLTAAVLLAALAVAPPAGAAPAAEVVPTLAAILQRAGDDPVPVIVRLRDHDAFRQVQQALDGLSPEHRFHLIPGFAARLTRAQVEVLQRLPGVVRIEPDPEIHAFLDGATHWFGTAKARRDFGLDGDRDGQPRRYTRDDVVIAVVDTGIDAGHVDLDGGKVIGWFDAVNGRPEPYDDHGHGTHVASIAAGEGDGNPAYQGVAPGAALVGIKVLAGDGSGRGSDLVRGIEWAIENKERYGIRILNMSLGTSQPSDGRDTLSEAIDRAAQAGLIPVVAAGNAGPAAGSVGSPAAARGAITVGAMADPAEGGFVLAWFSSRGPTQDGRLKPDVLAPGWGITAAKAGTRDGYVTYSGTSMATPFVSGTVALMLDANPRLGLEDVRRILHETAVDWNVPGPDPETGHGRLDGYAALARAAGRSGTPPAVPAHRVIQGTLQPQPLGRAAAEFPIDVADARYPVGISLLIPDHQPLLGPDLDLALIDPQGQEVARSATDRREETIRHRPAAPGRYVIRVEAKGWLLQPARFVLDVSAGLPGTPPPDVPPPPAPPPGDGNPPPASRPAVALERAGRLSAGGTAVHPFAVVDPGRVYLRLAAEQAEVALTVRDAGGAERARLAAPAGEAAERVLDLDAGAYRLELSAPAGDAAYRVELQGLRRGWLSGRVAPRGRAEHRLEADYGGWARVRLVPSGGWLGVVRLAVRDSAGGTREALGWQRPVEVTWRAAPGAVRVTVEQPWGWGPLDYRLEADLPAPLLRGNP